VSDRMRMSRRGVLGVGAGVVGALAAACAPAGDSGGAQPAASGRLVELRAHARAGSERDGYQKSVDEFNKLNEGKIKVIYEGLAGDPAYYGPLETNIVGGTVGDVLYAHTSNLKYQEYAVKNITINLDSYAAKDKNFKLADWPATAQDAMKVVDSKLYGMPIRGQISWLFLYWNIDLLKKVGVAEPTPDWTYEQLLSAARQMRGQGTVADFIPVGHASSGGFEQVVADMRRFGGEFFAEPKGGGKKSQLDSAQALQTYKFYYDNIKAGLFAPRTGYGAAEFGQGKMAFYFGRLAGERGTVAQNSKDAFQWTFNIVPKGPTGKRGGFLSVDMSSVTSNSKSKDAAWEFLKHITGKNSGINLALQPDGSLTPGFRKDVYCSDQLLNDARFPKTAMKANCDNIDQPDTYVFPANFRLTGPGHMQEILNKYINPFMDGQQEPTAAVLKELNTEIQRVLDMPRI
jgi:multiple sugar transport system substrate-binding protein